jgi:hypothetical protein
MRQDCVGPTGACAHPDGVGHEGSHYRMPQAVREALADAETLRMAALTLRRTDQPTRHRLTAAWQFGYYAKTWMDSDDADAAAYYAATAAHAAFLACPDLRVLD